MNDELFSVPCPFSAWASYEIYQVNTRVELVYAAQQFREALLHGGVEPTLSYIFDVAPEVHQRDIYGLASVLHTIVYLVMASEDERETVYADIRSADWRLRLCGTDFFVVVVSPCYSATHPRYVHRRSLILFQPESQFGYFNITTNEHRATYTRLAEAEFHRLGRRYFYHHQKMTPKSLRFVLDEDGSGVEWWTTQKLDGVSPR